MTRLLLAVGPDAAREGREWLSRSAPGARSWSTGPHVVLAAGAADGDVPPEVAVAGPCVAVADAALYYQADLRRQLREAGIDAPDGAPAAGLVLLAYRAWGDALAERLEGDFAFAVWDGERRLLVCGRDFVGRRRLHHALARDTLVVASSADAVAAHPRVGGEPDVGALAAVAAGLPELEWATGWRAVSALPAGRTLTARQDAAGRVRDVRVARHWTPPTFESWGGRRFEDAAEELRETLVRATAERMDEGRPTAVWLSGGYDSPAVYGAGHEAMRRGTASGPLAAVTMSYPPGDPGREDELVEQVVAHWDGRVDAWCDSTRVPLVGDTAEAATRDSPLAHPYAEWTRALAAATRGLGARVALDGGGGDQLFQVSPVYLADLVARLRLVAARREWHARGMAGAGWRRLARYALVPLAPAPMLAAARLLRGGRPVPGPQSWPVPPWIRPAVARDHGLAALGHPRVPRRAGERHSAAESRWYFESPYPPAVLGAQAAAAGTHGVELRSPLLDGRVIALAARRPREERSDRGRTKRLLRAAARGLVADPLLLPRPSRTGVTTGYFERALAAALPELAALVDEEAALVRLGVVDPAAFRDAADRRIRGGAGPHDVALFYTVQAELWLRARMRASGPSHGGVGRVHPGA